MVSFFIVYFSVILVWIHQSAEMDKEIYHKELAGMCMISDNVQDLQRTSKDLGNTKESVPSGLKTIPGESRRWGIS